jgi:hypothetical protein
MVTNAPIAAADRMSWSDDNDTHGKLDVRVVAQEHGGRGQLRHTIRMWETWRNRDLRNKESFIWVKLKPNGSGWRTLEIDVYRGSLYARLTCDCGRDGNVRVLGYAQVWRSGPRSVTVQFPPRLLKSHGLSSYRWRVFTHYSKLHSANCDYTPDTVSTCYDWAPNVGNFRHIL